MLFVAMLAWRDGLTAEQRDGALARRAAWSYPEGVAVRGEYWPAHGDPAVIVVFEAGDFAGIFELTLTWGDVFDITVVPATTPEEGLAMGPAAMQRAQAARVATPGG